MAEAAANNDPEKERDLQLEINDKIKYRAMMAKDLGERIVSPQKSELKATITDGL